MRIALINEASQVGKNKIIFETLKEVGNEYGHQVYNVGMVAQDDLDLTYVQAGLLTAILLNTKAVDFVVTGCGTGEGAMLACNSFPNVLCGYIVDPTDATLFARVNNGNAISIPYAKGFGWGSELTLTSIFKNLFESNFGEGYPLERALPEQTNKKILDEVKTITHQDMLTIVKTIDQNFLKETIYRPSAIELLKIAPKSELKEYLLSTIGNF